MATADKAVSRTLASIERLIADGDWYSAQQKARTTAARLLKPPTSTDKTLLVADLLYNTARQLLEKGESGSGTDLGLYLLETWSNANIKCGDAERTKIRTLLALVGPIGFWRKQLADATFNWSAKCGTCPAGDLQLHAFYGEQLAKEKQYAAAEPHLLASGTRESAELLAQILFDWFAQDTTSPKPESAGRYAARGALSYLEAECVLACRSFLARFLDLLLAAHPSVLIGRVSSGFEGTSGEDFVITNIATLNYLQLAVRNCQVGIGESKATPGPGEQVKKGMGRAAWQSLFSRYERDVPWLRTPELVETRQALSQRYFGIAPPAQAPNLASMLSGLMGGGAGRR